MEANFHSSEKNASTFAQRIQSWPLNIWCWRAEGLQCFSEVIIVLIVQSMLRASLLRKRQHERAKGSTSPFQKLWEILSYSQGKIHKIIFSMKLKSATQQQFLKSNILIQSSPKINLIWYFFAEEKGQENITLFAFCNSIITLLWGRELCRVKTSQFVTCRSPESEPTCFRQCFLAFPGVMRDNIGAKTAWGHM